MANVYFRLRGGNGEECWYCNDWDVKDFNQLARWFMDTRTEDSGEPIYFLDKKDIKRLLDSDYVDDITDDEKNRIINEINNETCEYTSYELAKGDKLEINLNDDSYFEYTKVYENSDLTKVFEWFFNAYHYVIFQIDDEFCVFYSQGQKKGNNWQEVAECRIDEIKEELNAEDENE